MGGKKGKSGIEGFLIFLGLIFLVYLIFKGSIFLCEGGIACDRTEPQPITPQEDNQQNISPEINDTEIIVISPFGEVNN